MLQTAPDWNLPAFDEADTRPVYCQECEQWFQPDASWLCPCGQRAAHAVQPGVCGACDQPANLVRTGHRLRTLCRCRETPAHRAMCEARWAEVEAEERREAEIAGRLAKPRKAKAERAPGLAEYAPVRDWWPGLMDLLPGHIDKERVFQSLDLARNDFTLESVVGACRRILERIKRKGTQVGSHAYLQSALERELEQTGRRLPPEMVEV